MTVVFILTITSHCSSIFCVFVFRREFSRMRNTHFPSTKGTAFLIQRILSTLDTFSKQPNHHSHQFQPFFYIVLGVHTYLRFQQAYGRPIDISWLKGSLYQSFPQNRKSEDSLRQQTRKNHIRSLITADC
jgi:hypothetical protein